MTRQLTLTAAEWASVQPDGTLWLAWEGTPCMAHEFDSPAEFVQACAPCGTCGDGRHFGVCHDCWAMTTGPWCPNCGGDCGDVPCPACRIELVGPCPHPANRLTRPLDGNYGAGGQKCRDCLAYRTDYTDWSPPEATVTLGHAYAIGQPLPIVTAISVHENDGPWNAVQVSQSGESLTGVVGYAATDLTAALAHYGPPETLVGRWAIMLKVVQ